MHVGEFPAAAANSLIQGYCDDFISLAALLAQTLEQVSMRGINISESNEGLERIESGMRNLADAIQDQLRSGRSTLTEGSLLAGMGPKPGQQTPDAPSGLEGYASYLSHETTEEELGNATGSSSADDIPADAVSTDAGPAASDSIWEDDLSNDGLSNSDLSNNAANEEATSSKEASDGDRSVKFDGRLRHGLDEDFVEAMMDPRTTPSYPTPDAPPDASKVAGEPLDPSGEPPAGGQPPTKQGRNGPSKRSGAFRPPAKATPADLTSEDMRPQSDGVAKPHQVPAPRTKRRPLRQPPATAAGQALKGTNHTMPVLSVFQFVERMRKSGVMTVKIADEVLTFEFDNGCVQACKSTCQDKGDRLGDLLIELCGCEPKAITDILYRTKGKSKLQLGEMILKSGCATNGQIMDALEAQVRRRFSRACKATDAIYEFIDCTPDRTDGRVRITPMELAFESSWTPDL